MLAARDQENLTYAHQNAAAAKPLNRSLAPKTPSNNTLNNRFKKQLTGKPTGKGDENATLVFKTSKPAKNAFITPLAPRDRAPLGAKTTNAKTKPFQTPAPLTVRPTPQKTQLRSNASARRPKLKIHHSIEPTPSILPDTTTTTTEDASEAETSDVPSIEHCGPKITELDDISSDEAEFWAQDFSFLNGSNMFKGRNAIWEGDIGEDGLTDAQREAGERMERQERERCEEMERVCVQRVERGWADGDEEAWVGGGGVPGKGEGMSSTAAAKALSTPSFAAPTAAAKARISTTKTKHAHLPSGPLPLPPAKANANANASRSTIGYAKGRKVSASLHPDAKKDGKSSGTAQASTTTKKNDTAKAGSTTNPAKSREESAAKREADLDQKLNELLEREQHERGVKGLEGMFDTLDLQHDVERHGGREGDWTRDEGKTALQDLFKEDREEFVLRWDE